MSYNSSRWFIDKTCIKSNSETIIEYNKRYQYEVDGFDYIFFMLFSNIFEFGTIIILSIIFNYYIPLLLYIPFWVLARHSCGGYHNAEFSGCFIVTMLIYFTSGLISKYMYNYYGICAIIASIVSIYIIPYTPFTLVSENSPSRGKEKDMEFRCRYKNIVIMFILLQLLFYWIVSHEFIIVSQTIIIKLLSMGASMALIFTYIMSSSMGKYFVEKVDSVIDKFK